MVSSFSLETMNAALRAVGEDAPAAAVVAAAALLSTDTAATRLRRHAERPFPAVFLEGAVPHEELLLREAAAQLAATRRDPRFDHHRLPSNKAVPAMLRDNNPRHYHPACPNEMAKRIARARQLCLMAEAPTANVNNGDMVNSEVQLPHYRHNAVYERILSEDVARRSSPNPDNNGAHPFDLVYSGLSTRPTMGLSCVSKEHLFRNVAGFSQCLAAAGDLTTASRHEGLQLGAIEDPFARFSQSIQALREDPSVSQVTRSLPSLGGGNGVAVPHYSQREFVPLAIDEDQNWLSEVFCFVRSELAEVFTAGKEDVHCRGQQSKKIAVGQVGIRCRFCAHLPPRARTARSACFPSSLSRIYQSLTMMLREHFGTCKEIPPELQKKFHELRKGTSQGTTNSKKYWVDAALKLGLINTEAGIGIASYTALAALGMRSGGNPQRLVEECVGGRPILLVEPSDRSFTSDFTFLLMTQAQKVFLTESERSGNRTSLAVGHPGFGCRHCCALRRKGKCRFFPVKRRTLPDKVDDFYGHILRCSVCPASVKKHLEQLCERNEAMDPTRENIFFDFVWARLRKN